MTSSAKSKTKQRPVLAANLVQILAELHQLATTNTRPSVTDNRTGSAGAPAMVTRGQVGDDVATSLCAGLSQLTLSNTADSSADATKPRQPAVPNRHGDYDSSELASRTGSFGNPRRLA